MIILVARSGLYRDVLNGNPNACSMVTGSHVQSCPDWVLNTSGFWKMIYTGL